MSAGILKRSQTAIEHEINDYEVIERHGASIGCPSLRLVEADPTWAELGCFVVHKSYRKLGKGDAMCEICSFSRRRVGTSSCRKHSKRLSTMCCYDSLWNNQQTPFFLPEHVMW